MTEALTVCLEAVAVGVIIGAVCVAIRLVFHVFMS